MKLRIGSPDAMSKEPQVEMEDVWPSAPDSFDRHSLRFGEEFTIGIDLQRLDLDEDTIQAIAAMQDYAEDAGWVCASWTDWPSYQRMFRFTPPVTETQFTNQNQQPDL